ncbi:MAG: riboflavin synthase [Longimicrobiales bacterium]
MFTGIVEEVGRVRSIERRKDGLRLVIAATRVLDTLKQGDSISIEGVCQTVVDHDADGFAVDTIATTLSRTTMGQLRVDDGVNLERALAFGARMGGHLVQGHVDAVGTVRSVAPSLTQVLLDVEVTDEVDEVTVLHGSIAISGVSLTVNALPARRIVQVALIPHTWERTTLSRRRPGDRVNLEGDLVGKFVAHYMKRRGAAGV